MNVLGKKKKGGEKKRCFRLERCRKIKIMNSKTVSLAYVWDDRMPYKGPISRKLLCRLILIYFQMERNSIFHIEILGIIFSQIAGYILWLLQLSWVLYHLTAWSLEITVLPLTNIISNHHNICLKDVWEPIIFFKWNGLIIIILL